MKRYPLPAILIIFLGLVILFNIIFFIQRSRRLSSLSDITNELVLDWSKVQFQTLNLLFSEDHHGATLEWSTLLQLFKDNFELLTEQKEILRIQDSNRDIAGISGNIESLWKKAEGEYIDLIASLYHVTESITRDSPLRDYGLILWPEHSSPSASRYYGEMIRRIEGSLILDRSFESDIVRMKELIQGELNLLQRALYLSSLLTENPDPVLRFSYEGEILQSNEASRPLLEHWKADRGTGLPEKLRDRIKSGLTDRRRTSLERKSATKPFS